MLWVISPCKGSHARSLFNASDKSERGRGREGKGESETEREEGRVRESMRFICGPWPEARGCSFESQHRGLIVSQPLAGIDAQLLGVTSKNGSINTPLSLGPSYKFTHYRAVRSALPPLSLSHTHAHSLALFQICS